MNTRSVKGQGNFRFGGLKKKVTSCFVREKIQVKKEF